ncbi:MAG: S24/S26 family peptidase [Anaerolineae bacterium]
MNNYRRLALDLVSAGFAEGNPIRLKVTSNSMAPLLRAGDAVWAEPALPASLRRGDVVVIQHAGGLVTHRLVAVGDGEWLTKGDNTRRLDPPVKANAILGRVVAIERGGDRIELRGRQWAIVNRLMGLASWWGARFFRAGRQVKRLGGSG